MGNQNEIYIPDVKLNEKTEINNNIKRKKNNQIADLKNLENIPELECFNKWLNSLGIGNYYFSQILSEIKIRTSKNNKRKKSHNKSNENISDDSIFNLSDAEKLKNERENITGDELRHIICEIFDINSEDNNLINFFINNDYFIINEYNEEKFDLNKIIKTFFLLAKNKMIKTILEGKETMSDKVYFLVGEISINENRIIQRKDMDEYLATLIEISIENILQIYIGQKGKLEEKEKILGNLLEKIYVIQEWIITNTFNSEFDSFTLGELNDMLNINENFLNVKYILSRAVKFMKEKKRGKQ